jgi:endonuclease/exonuclease/phosphatase family metal-dependent hydrolase
MSTASASPSRGRRFTPGRVVIFLIIVAALMIWEGSRKIPLGAASGTLLVGSEPASRPSGDVLRVATFNIDGKSGDDTAATLSGFDLIGLEEVHGCGPWSKSNQAEILGQKLNMPALFAPVERQWWCDAFGDGVLTTLPLEHWQRFPLANEIADSNREVLVLRLQFAGQPLNVLITHLERHEDLENELATVISLFKSMQAPAILMGDLNLTKSNSQIDALRKTSGVADPIGDISPDSFDRIFARGMTSLNSGFVDKGASDHPLAWAELKLIPASPANSTEGKGN